MKSNRPGIIEIADSIPYEKSELANEFNLELKTVEMGMALFQRLQMIEIYESGSIEVINFMKHQELEKILENKKKNREKVQRFREKQKLLCNGYVTVTKPECNHTDIDRDLDTDTEKDRERGVKQIITAPPVPETEEKKQKEKDDRYMRPRDADEMANLFTYLWMEKNPPGTPEYERMIPTGRLSLEAERCFDHYSANGWKQTGGLPIKDYYATVRNWFRNMERFQTRASPEKNRRQY